MVTASDVESWCGLRTVDFHPSHIHLMELTDYSRWFKQSVTGYTESLWAQAQNNPAFTLFYDDKPFLSFGFYELWGGVAEGWMVPSNRIERNPIVIGKAGRAVFYHIGPAMQLRRLQFTVRSSHLQAVRFAEFVKFKREATLKEYGPEGDDYHIYVRFYDE